MQVLGLVRLQTDYTHMQLVADARRQLDSRCPCVWSPQHLNYCTANAAHYS